MQTSVPCTKCQVHKSMTCTSLRAEKSIICNMSVLCFFGIPLMMCSHCLQMSCKCFRPGIGIKCKISALIILLTFRSFRCCLLQLGASPWCSSLCSPSLQAALPLAHTLWAASNLSFIEFLAMLQHRVTVSVVKAHEVSCDLSKLTWCTYLLPFTFLYQIWCCAFLQ